jgi:hypothetical protein
MESRSGAIIIQRVENIYTLMLYARIFFFVPFLDYWSECATYRINRRRTLSTDKRPKEKQRLKKREGEKKDRASGMCVFSFGPTAELRSRRPRPYKSGRKRIGLIVDSSPFVFFPG